MQINHTYLPKRVELNGTGYPLEWELHPNMDGWRAKINIGRRLDDTPRGEFGISELDEFWNSCLQCYYGEAGALDIRPNGDVIFYKHGM